MSLFFKKYKKIFLVGLFFHFIATIFSVGHLHPDEHFQILEFLGLKLGTTNAKDLPWEYQAKMRPWIQPAIYYFISKFEIFLGIDNRFSWVLSFRFLSSLLGFFSLFYFCYNFSKKLKEDWQIKWLVIFSNICWFFPFMHARLSSETFGASLFIIGFTLFLKEGSKTQSLFAGLLLGVSFAIRYHIAIFLVAIFIHQIIFNRKKIVNTLTTTLGVIFAILLTIFIDYWGYESFTIAPYEYFMQNILHKKAAGFGVSPWWDYFKSVNKKAIFPFGPILIISFIYYWIKRPKDIFTFVTLSFFLVHSSVGHKEWRFLFPIAPFIPWFLLYFISEIKSKIKKSFHAPLIKFLLSVNIVLLIISSIKPVHPSYSFFQATNKITHKINKLFYTSHESPYNLYGLKQSFFAIHNPKLIQVKSINSIKSQNDQVFWVFTERVNGYLKVKKELTYCRLYYTSYPEIIIKYLGTNLLKRSKAWSLFSCDKKNLN